MTANALTNKYYIIVKCYHIVLRFIINISVVFTLKKTTLSMLAAYKLRLGNVIHAVYTIAENHMPLIIAQKTNKMFHHAHGDPCSTCVPLFYIT